jgi:hypothetical protein
MTTNFLADSDYEFQSDNEALKVKADAINEFTSLLLLDLSDEATAHLEKAESVFEVLKGYIFANNDKIWQYVFASNDKNYQLSEGIAEEAELKEKQVELLTEWKKFGFTEGFFKDMYYAERGQLNTDLTDIERERLELLQAILNEQKTLVMAFNVSMSKNVILDIDEYM